MYRKELGEENGRRTWSARVLLRGCSGSPRVVEVPTARRRAAARGPRTMLLGRGPIEPRTGYGSAARVGARRWPTSVWSCRCAPRPRRLEFLPGEDLDRAMSAGLLVRSGGCRGGRAGDEALGVPAGVLGHVGTPIDGGVTQEYSPWMPVVHSSPPC